MKSLMAFGLLLVAILVTPTASLAIEAVGIRHTIPCFQCAPDIVESFHIARPLTAPSTVVQTNIYDANGILLGNFAVVAAAGTFIAQQVVFTTTQALTSAGLPAGLYSAVLFDTLGVTNVFYEQVGVNAAGVVGILTGRGNLYNYNPGGVVSVLTLVPEAPGPGTFPVTNFFVCNNPANQMATFLGIAGPAALAQAVAQFITTNGNLVVNNFPTQSLFARPLVQITPSGPTGGSLFIIPPGATRMACVRFIRLTGGPTVGGYSY